MPGKIVPACVLLLLWTTFLPAKSDNNCTITDNVFKCINVNLTSNINTLTIPSHVDTAIITGGNIYELPPHLFSDETCTDHDPSNLKYLYLDGNEIQTINETVFKCLPNLKNISLSDNKWYVRDDTVAVLANLTDLKELSLRQAFDHMYNDTTRMVIRFSRVFSETANLEKLDLSDNDLLVFTSEASDALCNFPSLKFLNLSRNALSKVSLNSCNKKLEYIDLSSNSFETVTSEELQVFDEIQKSSPNFTVNFNDNEWDCDCTLRGFVKWLNSTRVKVVDKEKLRCHDGQNLPKELLKLAASDLVCKSYPVDGVVKAPIIVLSIVLAVICFVVIVAVYTRRQKIKAWFTNLREQRQSHDDGYIIV